MSRRRRQRRVEVAVLRQGRDMLGEGDFDTRRVLVRDALPGETVMADVVKRHRGEWLARPVQLAYPSPLRRVPACSAFPICGGCAAQHLDSGDQLQWKERQLIQELAAAGLMPAQLRAPVAGRMLHYRRKARLAVRFLADKDELLIGFREAFGNKVARIDACPVLVQPFADRVDPIKALVRALSVAGAVPQIELAAGDDRAVMILRHLAPLSVNDQRLLADFSCRHGIEVLVQPGGYDTVSTLHGDTPEALHYHLSRYELTLSFGATDFIQINAEMNSLLVDAALRELALERGDRVLDLFCGIGNFTLPIARQGIPVVGLEGNPALVARAGYNAARNGLEGTATFAVADLYQEGELGCTTGDINKVLVDPPRSGVGAALRHLHEPHVQRVVYVSCHAHSFVRDAAALVAAGFTFASVGLFDMFPNTTHAEVLATFERR